MRLNNVNSKNDVVLESFHALLENIFRGTELDPIETGMEEYKQIIDKVAEDPESATEDEIIHAIKYYKRLVIFLKQVGPKLAEARKVLDIAKSIQSGDNDRFKKELHS